MQTMIKIENLSKCFVDEENTVCVLKNINLSVSQGECIILKGASGSGKTTLLSLIAGLDRPTEGIVLIENEPISKLPDHFASDLRARKIGMVFQHFNLFEHLSVRENVTLPLIPSGLNMSQINPYVDSALKLAHIDHKQSMIANRLSGGEKQRTAIARALVAAPHIILCDEPTANLDRENSLLFIQTLKNLHAIGKTIIVATHDPLFDHLDFKTTVVPMEDGKIITKQS